MNTIDNAIAAGAYLLSTPVELGPDDGAHLLPRAGVQRTLEAISCSARLCENPVFWTFRLHKPLNFLDRIFVKSTFDTVWRVVRLDT